MLNEKQLSFHPLTNDASTVIASADLGRWISHTGHGYSVVDLSAGTVVSTV
jgi:hypothetical protein